MDNNNQAIQPMTPDPPTPRMDSNNQDTTRSPSTITMDRGEEENRQERFTGYTTRSTSGRYRTSYGREINPPERLTTGAFQFIQEAIALVINEEAQDIPPQIRMIS